MQLLGIQTLILTNAAGGMNPAFKAGDLMLLNDHIGLAALVGANPLLGPNDDSLGPRFPGMSHVYDKELRQMAHQVAQEADFELHEGVYVGLSGPMFETPAELRFLHNIGADAVGMSTVPEAIVAVHGGMRVMGVSTITNVAVTEIDAEDEPTHEEVLETGQIIAPRLTALIRGVLRRLGDA
jgi:purine-nucleoside phosphorylase